MSAIIGPHLIDLWDGPIPPQIKTRAITQFRPGQATAAVKLLPAQSHEAAVKLTQFRSAVGADEYVDTLRGLIGTILPVLFRGENYGTVLIKDIRPEEIRTIAIAEGTHPNGVEYSYSPAARIVATWELTRLS